MSYIEESHCTEKRVRDFFLKDKKLGGKKIFSFHNYSPRTKLTIHLFHSHS
jgi:hypothetical protein